MHGEHVQYILIVKKRTGDCAKVWCRAMERARNDRLYTTISLQRVAGYDYTGPQPDAFKLCWNAVHLSAKTRHRLNTFLLRFKN
jgi:hypothetical protein